MGLVWIGHTKGAEGLFNIPARDLNAIEVERYGGETALLATGLYTKVPTGTKSSSKANETPKPFTYPADEQEIDNE